MAFAFGEDQKNSCLKYCADMQKLIICKIFKLRISQDGYDGLLSTLGKFFVQLF
jgi:hypothetical protein